MNFADDIDYEAVEAALSNLECEVTTSELQGVLCGFLASGIAHKNTPWQIVLAEMLNEAREFPPEVKEIIQHLYQWSEHNLVQDETLAPILLPDDSYPAIDILEAVVNWSLGFLLGFGLQTEHMKLDKEVAESINDIIEISQLEIAIENTPQNESELEIVIEHIKVAVQLIYLERVIKNTGVTGSSETLH